MKVYSLPLSYRFSSDFKVNTSIPYIQRTIKRDDVEFKADGLGDISLGMEYRWYNSTKFQASTSVDLILPTGDTEAIGKNNGQQLTVPLGSGSLSTYLVQHGTWWINNDLKLFGNIGIRYATPAEYTAYPSVMQTSNATGQNIREEKGMVYTGMIGSEYRLTKDVAVAGRFSIIAVQEGKKSIDHADYVDSNDALLAGDASVTIKYRVHKNTSIGLTGIIPAFTRYDKNVENPEDRTWGVNFSISTFF